jgi:hypothetical protein
LFCTPRNQATVYPLYGQLRQRGDQSWSPFAEGLFAEPGSAANRLPKSGLALADDGGQNLVTGRRDAELGRHAVDRVDSEARPAW